MKSITQIIDRLFSPVHYLSGSSIKNLCAAFSTSRTLIEEHLGTLPLSTNESRVAMALKRRYSKKLGRADFNVERLAKNLNLNKSKILGAIFSLAARQVIVVFDQHFNYLCTKIDYENLMYAVFLFSYRIALL